MRRKIGSAIVAGIMIGALAAPSLARTPKGQRGYEGRPGNQGGHHQSGQQSYEGQPGNQSGKRGR